ncbi:hypothetical protein FKW77_007473 [Venturia effusa]|uniref:DNA repair protein rad9 n=1 Tax=Venturia effusa TaxID=50376 RepID=A0A517LJ55_9PEZI|nr:hypothetical protein FKW77_007473 [Venturia effusa]
MVALKFILTPEASSRLHDVLTCLAKFSDTVSIEAQKENLILSSLNLSKSGYASFALDRSYFSAFVYAPDTGDDGRFTCSIPNKALISVFKARITDARGRETAIDRCEVHVQDQADETQCRFIIRMICNHGVTKTYKLTYESTEVMHALFDRTTANNRWSMRSPFLKEFSDYFGPKAEQLDIYYEEGKVTFLSFTDKVISSKNEILKHPLKTAVSVNKTDFEHFDAQEKLHIIISVKDFKSIVNHADTLHNTPVNAYYSAPGRPFQFSYSKEGIQCQFTLMTTGEYNGTPTPSAAPVDAPNAGPPSIPRAQSTVSMASESRRSNVVDMPPPAKPAPRRPVRKLGQNENGPSSQFRQQTEEDPDSLFVPAAEEDRRWEPMEYDNDNDEEAMVWDASASHDDGFHPTIRDTSTPIQRSNMAPSNEPAGLAATQRISQLQEDFGLW